MDYPQAVDFIFGFTNYEFTPLQASPAGAFQLARLRSLLDCLGNPQLPARSVHITGSKGKGSTARMIAALIECGSHGPIGLYTSPHLHTPCERIAIDGVPIAEQEFARLATELRRQVETEHADQQDGPPTTFELLTALAFMAFREHACKWQVVEVGLGGTLDATNVLDRKSLCVFTPISLEHTAILGPTTAAIATDKAGILRRGSRAVIGLQDASAGEVLHRACERLDVPFECAGAACSWSVSSAGLDGQDCTVQTPRSQYNFHLPLLGRYQVENAATALLAVENLAGEGVRLEQPEAAKALGMICWPGRLEVLSRTPLVLVDGAHNAASAQRLAEALAELSEGRPLTLIIGTLADKDLAGMVETLAPLATRVIAVAPDHPRARPAADLQAAFSIAGSQTRGGSGVAAALRAAMDEAGSDGAICVTGSLYTVAEARAALLDVSD
jgi:dihydrofolate synthase/folylpolyglutamate synthase